MNYGLDGFQRAKWRARKWLHNLAKRFIRPLKINWGKHISKTYILHLEDREDRKELLSAELNQVYTYKGTLLDHVTWWPAVKNVIKWPAHWHINKYSFDFHWVVDPDPQHLPELNKLEDLKIDCSPAETAIACGHIQMWKDFVASGEETAMFLEDDVYFVYDFEEKARSIFEKELPKDWDILYLSALPNKWGFTWDPHSKNLSRLYNGVWWMSGYCLKRKAALHLLNELPIVGPIDVWINYKFEGLQVYLATDDLICQADNTESDNTYSFMEKFYW